MVGYNSAMVGDFIERRYTDATNEDEPNFFRWPGDSHWSPIMFAHKAVRCRAAPESCLKTDDRIDVTIIRVGRVQRGSWFRQWSQRKMR